MASFRRSITVLFLALCSSHLVLAQTQEERNQEVYEHFIRFFEKKQTDSIYALTGEVFQKAISVSKFEGVARQLYQLGPVLDSEFLSFVNGISSYKLEFRDVNLKLVIGLDSAAKLKTFLFKPWVDERALKSAPVPTDNKLATVLDRKVDSIARSYIQREKTVAMSIGLLKDGQMHFYNYGSVRKGGDTLPEKHSIYEIGSISKTFTSLLLAYYANEGMLRLDDPVTKFLPDSVVLNSELKQVTLRMLANHTSGLPRLPTNLAVVARDPLNPYKHYTDTAMYAYLVKAKLASTPGQVYAYSNLGFGVLGHVLEKVSGLNYEEMVRTLITAPLKMRSTAQTLPAEQESSMLPVYNEKGDETPAWEFQVIAPAGALRSSSKDLLLYAQAQMRQDVDKLSKAIQLTQQETFKGEAEVGLGWHINMLEDLKIYSHGGGTYGSRSFIGFIPEQKVAVVILSNSAQEVGETGMELLSLMVGE